MAVNDSIADMLARIRNASNARHDKVVIPFSKMKKAIADVMLNEGFINNVEVAGEKTRKAIVIDLKYMEDGSSVIRSMQRVSKLGRRVYSKASEIQLSRQGMGVGILSTPKGILKDVDAKRMNVGGEILCTIW